MTTPTTNTTGLHPCPGYILAEFLDIEKPGDLIQIPSRIKANMVPTEDTHRIIVLEDRRREQGDMENGFTPGTRIIVPAQHGLTFKGRKLLFVKAEDVVCTVDPEVE